jgi:hypothetical protein
MIKDNTRTLIPTLHSESNRIQFYSVIFLILVLVLGNSSLETTAVGSQTVYAKKHTATAQNPGSQASPVAGDTCAAGSAQGRADFNSSGRLDQSIFDKHGTIFQDCYIKSFQSTCLSQGNTEAACNDAQDA